MKKETIYRSAAKYSALHDEDCCVNTEYGCDVDTPILGCCENMKMVESIIRETVASVVESLSHDIGFDSEEQRKAGVEMYLENFNH